MHLVASVVVPALNAVGVIDDQLEALVRQVDAPPFEVVVADNGSSDGTREWVERWADRLTVRVVDASARKGVSYARNVGAREAAGRFVLFCDADDRVDPGWVRAMVDALGADDLVGGPLVYSQINTARSQEWAQVEDSSTLPTALRHLPYAPGGNLGCSRELLVSLGGFDLSYRGGHEEVDFAWRAQEQSGATVGWAEGAVLHYRMRDSLRALVRQRYHYGRTNAQLQRRFADRPGLPPTTVRRQVRILLSHFADLLAVRSRDQLAAWCTGLGWAVGRVVGMVAPLPPRELMPTPAPGGEA